MIEYHPGAKFRHEREKLTIFLKNIYFNQQYKTREVILEVHPDNSDKKYTMIWMFEDLARKIDSGIWTVVEAQDAPSIERLERYREERFRRRVGPTKTWKWTFKRG